MVLYWNKWEQISKNSLDISSIYCILQDPVSYTYCFDFLGRLELIIHAYCQICFGSQLRTRLSATAAQDSNPYTVNPGIGDVVYICKPPCSCPFMMNTIISRKLDGFPPSNVLAPKVQTTNHIWAILVGMASPLSLGSLTLVCPSWHWCVPPDPSRNPLTSLSNKALWSE